MNCWYVDENGMTCGRQAGVHRGLCLVHAGVVTNNEKAAKVRDAALEMLALLRRIEWVGDWQNNRVVPRCYFCAGARPLSVEMHNAVSAVPVALVGHGPECPYSKLLARIDGET